MATSPFVNFGMQPTQGVTNTSTLIFGNDTNVCLLDGVLLSNTSNNLILATLLVAREETTGTETYFTLANQVAINPNSMVDALNGMTLTLQPGDLLYANSDISSNTFDVFVSHRVLTELFN